LRGRKKAAADAAKAAAAAYDKQAPAPHSNGAGIIRPDTGALKLPLNYDDLGAQESSPSSINIVLVIVILAITFITIIAYFVSQMAEKS
jgi:hypothetical protein